MTRAVDWDDLAGWGHHEPHESVTGSWLDAEVSR